MIDMDEIQQRLDRELGDKWQLMRVQYERGRYNQIFFIEIQHRDESRWSVAVEDADPEVAVARAISFAHAMEGDRSHLVGTDAGRHALKAIAEGYPRPQELAKSALERWDRRA